MMKKVGLISFATFWFLGAIVRGAVVLVPGQVYFQDFDTLASSGQSNVLPDGWILVEGGSNANGYYTANDGSSQTGDSYSYGEAGSSERALGSLTSSSLTPVIFGLQIQNGGSDQIPYFVLQYDGEQWREGTETQDKLIFEYSVNASALNDEVATWTEVPSLSFDPPWSGTQQRLNGNLPENRQTLSGQIPITLAPGETLWIRWRDVDVTGYDAGMAIDNVRILAVPEPASSGLLAGGLCIVAAFILRRRL